MPALLATPSLTALDTVLKACADPTRLRILHLRSTGERCVRDIGQVLCLPQPAVRWLLAYLRRAGLVAAARECKFARVIDSGGSLSYR